MKLTAAILLLGFLSSVVTSTGQELVINGSFEKIVHNFPAGWGRTDDTTGRTVATWSIDEGPASPHALKIDCSSLPKASNSPSIVPADVFQKGIALLPGRKYVLTFKAKGAPANAVAATVGIGDATNGTPSLFTAAVTLTDSWAPYRFEFITPGKSVNASSVLWFTLNSEGTLWVDEVSLAGSGENLQAQAVPPEFQPRLAPGSHRNLVPNGSFESGTDGWRSLGDSLSFGGSIAGLYGAVEAGGACEGRRAFKLTLGPGATPESYFDCWPPAHVSQQRLLTANRGWIRVEPGRPYTLSAYMRSEQPGIKGVLQFNFNGDARTEPQRVAKEFALTDKWQRISYTVIAPAASVYIAVGPDARGASPEEKITVWTDAIQLEAGDAATAFVAYHPVELGFASERYGDVFTAGAPVTINLSASNETEHPVDLTVALRLTDYWDQDFLRKNLALQVPSAGDTVQPVSLDLPPGFYRAHFTWVCEGREYARTMPLTVINPYAHHDSPFGLNHGPTTLEACRQINQAGVTWIRDWSVNWQWAEPEPGALSFKDIDPQIARVRAAGMNILGLLPSNPSTNWASGAPDSVPAQLWYRLAYAPKDPELLNAFVSKAAARYKGSVTYWEFLNEPLWVPDFCLPQKGGYTVATYLALLKGAAAAIRSANPEAKIIGGLAIQSEMPLGDEFIKAGGLDYVDILNLHPYPGTRTPESFIPDMERINQVMEEHGTRKRIWATETGYYGIDEFPYLPWQPPVDDFATNRLLKSEQQCGDYLIRYSTILLAYGVDKIFWHEPIAGEANNAIRDAENVFIGPGGVPKKGYAAISALANVLGESPVFHRKWPVSKEISGRSTANVHGYAFASGDHSVLVAWAVAGPDAPADWQIGCPEGAQAQSIIGAPLRRRQVTLSESPVYITSSSLKPEELAAQCELSLVK